MSQQPDSSHPTQGARGRGARGRGARGRGARGRGGRGRGAREPGTWDLGGRDRGAATVWLLAAGLVLVGMGVAAAAVGTATVARHRAQAAADLGALAGVIRAAEGVEVACGRAAEIVTANGGRLTACTLAGFDVIVEVEVSVSPVRGISRSAGASARAGPVRAPVA